MMYLLLVVTRANPDQRAQCRQSVFRDSENHAYFKYNAKYYDDSDGLGSSGEALKGASTGLLSEDPHRGNHQDHTQPDLEGAPGDKGHEKTSDQGPGHGPCPHGKDQG